MQVFYTPKIKNITYQLTEEESKHAIKVLRLKAGDEICMIDGVGGMYFGIIDEPDTKKCTIRVIEKIEQYNRRNYYLHIAIAPTKNNERFEWFLEKATEIGIDEITPIVCQHSERKVIKHDRFEKIILSAMKQSIKAYKPILNELTKFSDFIKNCDSTNTFIAHCENVPKPSLKSQVAECQQITILIGPEGDFSQKEIEMAKNIGIKEIHLGKSRLRTETAGIVACNTINILKDE
jgi:16S rRNA (uracil1498-N3)-methyltransferase